VVEPPVNLMLRKHFALLSGQKKGGLFYVNAPLNSIESAVIL